MKMRVRECFLMPIGLLLCIFQFSLSQELTPKVVTINVAERCLDNSTLNFEYLSNAILKAEGKWPQDCEISLGKDPGKSIVISFYQHDLKEIDELLVRDSEGTEMSLRGKGNYWFEEKSFIFKGLVVIHYATNGTSYSTDIVKFQFVFTVTHDFLCTKDEFECSNRQCIAKHLVCDGHNNCGDMSDETSCGDYAGQFDCANKKTIPLYKICNGHNDCGDMSDEEICYQDCKIGEQYKCNNTRCIANSQVCDGRNDCGDWGDEIKCYRKYICDFRCNNSICIDSLKICNNRDDCGDMSDEQYCRKCELPYEFRCSNRKCIPQDLVCNKHDDCGDFSDEKHCGVKCSRDEFRCSVSKCIPMSLVCNKHNDCGDFSDEYCYPELKMGPVLRNRGLITLTVCTAFLAIFAVTLAAILIRKKIKSKKKPLTSLLSNISTNTNHQNVQTTNHFGRIRQSLRSGRQSTPSSIQPPGEIHELHATSRSQGYQTSSMYLQLQCGVESSNVHQMPRTNFLERARQSFRSGRQSALSSIQPPGHSEPPPPVDPGAQIYQVPPMYPHLQSCVDHPELRAEE